ncbi:MAG: hypothetical protein EBX52_07285, partial [Proteobacteria bacterium]|nr:hypothetical protein [Pseudomonadota bacterium]
PEVSRKFKGIVEATRKLESALIKRDFQAAVDAIREEWETRKTLAAGISTPEMEDAYVGAKAVTDLAFKVCGAGGGGCFFILLPTADAGIKEAVRTAVLKSSDIRPLPFEAVPHGLTVRA